MAPRKRGIVKSVHSPGQLALCELMVAARAKAGLTQQSLADALKRPQSFVAKYEGGERRLDVLEFIAVAQAMGADPVRVLKDLLKRLS